MPKAYIVVNRRKWTPAPAAYVEKYREGLATHGGRVIVSTADFDVREGRTNFDRFVMVEFADKASAIAAYEDYHREVAPLLGPVDRDMFIVEGTP
jgi:uncharacterized protein (DUF1330 family)